MEIKVIKTVEIDDIDNFEELVENTDIRILVQRFKKTHNDSDIMKYGWTVWKRLSQELKKLNNNEVKVSYIVSV